MKKLLFIALLSLVTLGAKAYDVYVINNSSCLNLRISWNGSIHNINSTSMTFSSSDNSTNGYIKLEKSTSCCIDLTFLLIQPFNFAALSTTTTTVKGPRCNSSIFPEWEMNVFADTNGDYFVEINDI